jgi:hypothetical protein
VGIHARAGNRGAVHSDFKEFPPRAKPGSFNLDQVLQKMQQPTNN